jgi:hypothetical protein
VNFSGFLAWFLWRGIYWSKLPRRKESVAIDWTLDVFFSKDFVQYLDQRALATPQTETGAAPWNRNQLTIQPKTTIASRHEEPVEFHSTLATRAAARMPLAP